MLLYVAKSLSFNPFVFITGSPKLHAFLRTSEFPVLSFNAPESKM